MTHLFNSAGMVSRRWIRTWRTKKGAERSTAHPVFAIPPEEDTQGLYLLHHSMYEDPRNITEHAFLWGNRDCLLKFFITKAKAKAKARMCVLLHWTVVIWTELVTEKGNERVACCWNSTCAGGMGRSRVRRNGARRRENMVSCHSPRIPPRDANLMLGPEVTVGLIID